MKIIKHIFILFLVLMSTHLNAYSYTDEEEECMENTEIYINKYEVLSKLSDDDRLRFVYCLVDEYEGENVENEKDIIESEEIEVVNRASQEEMKLLISKRDAIQVDDKDLSFGERKTLVELQSGLDCGGKIKPGENNNIITCIRDQRKQAFKMYDEDDSYLGGAKRWVNGMLVGIVNGILFGFSEFVSNSAFGYSKFDELPDIPYENIGDMFDLTTLYGMVNSFALAVLGFIILYYFLKIGVGKGGDDYKLFLMKVFFILLFVVFFSFLYKGLQASINTFETSLIDSTSKLTSLDQTSVANGIRMDVFDLGALTSISIWTLIFFLPNVLLLLVISVAVFIRDIFLITLLNVFFLSAVGFLGGTLKKDDIFESSTVSSKMAKFSTYAMFWVISLFITVVVVIFSMKFITVILASVPSIETQGVSVTGNINNFSIDAFIYLLLILILGAFAKKKLHPSIFNGVSNFLKGLLFPDSKKIGGHNDFINDIKDGYSDVKMEREHLMKNNEVFKNVKDKVYNPAISKTKDLVEKNKLLNNSSEFLNKNQTLVRGTLSTTMNASKIMSGIGSTPLTNKQFIAENKSEIDRELKRRREELDILDENDPKNTGRIQKLNTRIDTLEQNKKDLLEHEKLSTGSKKNRLAYSYDKEISEVDEQVSKTDNELSEKRKKLSENKEDLSKLDIEKDSVLIEGLEKQNIELEEDINILEKTKIAGKQLKSLKENKKKVNLEELDKKRVGGDIKIPSILGGRKPVYIDISKKSKLDESSEEELNTANISEETSEKRKSLDFELNKESLKEDINDFNVKYQEYKKNYDENIFGENLIFKHLYKKEVERAGGKEYVDIEILSNNLEKTYNNLKINQ